MQDLFIEFLPPWVETGLQPAFYDRESGTVLQQTARMYAKVNELVKAVNGMDKIIKEYVDYIDHYFENLDVQEEINNKLDAMAEGGELAEFIAQYANLPCVHAYDTIADMASSANLVDGSFARAMSKTVAGTGDGAYYKIREAEEGDDPDGENLVAIANTTLVAEIIPDYNLEALGTALGEDIEDVDDRVDEILTESDVEVKSGYIYDNFYNMIKIPKDKFTLSLTMSDSYSSTGIYQYIRDMANCIFVNGPLHGPTVNNGIVVTQSASSDDEYLYYLGIDTDGDYKYTKDASRSLSGSDLVALGYKTVFPIFYPIVLGGIAFDYNSEIPGVISVNVKHPRTIFGYDDTHVYIVVVEGRSQRSLGISYADMIPFCQSLGITNAFNLDGGGSTQLWLTNPAFNIVNQDSSNYGYGYSSRKVYGLIKMEFNND